MFGPDKCGLDTKVCIFWGTNIFSCISFSATKIPKPVKSKKNIWINQARLWNHTLLIRGRICTLWLFDLIIPLRSLSINLLLNLAAFSAISRELKISFNSMALCFGFYYGFFSIADLLLIHRLKLMIQMIKNQIPGMNARKFLILTLRNRMIGMNRLPSLL